MASAIPMALSLLQAVAPSNPAPQKSATNGGPLNPSATTQSSSHTTKQSSSAPVNIPGSQSNTTSNHKANSAMAAGSSPPKSNSNLCDVSDCGLRAKPLLTLNWQYCHLRPKYADGSKIHLYCGRTCATKAKSSGGSTSSNSTTSSSSNSSNCDVRRCPIFSIPSLTRNVAVLSYAPQVPRWCSNTSVLQQGLCKQRQVQEIRIKG